MFADRLPLAERYAAWLADAGTVRGLIGPREVPRLWDRHLLNSAVVQELIAPGASVADIGSGAGLPGLVLGIARRDLRVTLIEPLLRRTTFLNEVVDDLGLTNVEVVRARAEEVTERSFDVVTSRAVAALEKLAGWSLPLVRQGGVFLPMKGAAAAEEVAQALPALRRMGVADSPSIVLVGEGVVAEPVTVIQMVRNDAAAEAVTRSGVAAKGARRRARRSR